MVEDILETGSRHVGEVRAINRDLVEKALHMRCVSYLSKIKEQLLLQTIFEIDSSKKALAEMARDVKEKQETIRLQNEELEEKNLYLRSLQEELERRVDERTSELEIVNQELRREVDERKRAEKEKKLYQEQFLQAQKMDSLGRLAGGVAHDFNNLLTAILGYSRLALRKLDADSPLAKDLNVILDAGERGAALIRQLMTLSRKQKLHMRVVNLNDVVGNMSEILRRMVGAHLEIEILPCKGGCNVMADISQVEQVLLNLAVNARDAMPNGGRLIIETVNVRVDKSHYKYKEGMPPGTYVMLSVTDTGEGMAPEVRDKIFEPFFTTKARGKGTGLGLSTVHGIVTQHKGYISVISEVGEGSTFRVYFKTTEKEMETAVSKESSAMPHGAETILVVDDDPAILDLVTDTLQPLGYRVLEAPGGEDALELARCDGNPIHLLLTDVIMPGMNGGRLRDEFKMLYPDTKVVFMSGYVDSIVVQQVGGGKKGVEIVQKPFSPGKLARKLRGILDGKA